MAPYKKPERDLPDNEFYNNHVSMVRIRSEHAIGFLKGRFASLKHLRIHIKNKTSHNLRRTGLPVVWGSMHFQCIVRLKKVLRQSTLAICNRLPNVVLLYILVTECCRTLQYILLFIYILVARLWMLWPRSECSSNPKQWELLVCAWGRCLSANGAATVTGNWTGTGTGMIKNKTCLWHQIGRLAGAKLDVQGLSVEYNKLWTW